MSSYKDALNLAKKKHFFVLRAAGSIPNEAPTLEVT
jgi:hypothetical protein